MPCSPSATRAVRTPRSACKVRLPRHDLRGEDVVDVTWYESWEDSFKRQTLAYEGVPQHHPDRSASRGLRRLQYHLCYVSPLVIPCLVR